MQAKKLMRAPLILGGALLLGLSSATAAVAEGPDDTVTPEITRAVGAEEELGRPMAEGLTSVGVGYTTDAQGRALGVLIARGDPSVLSVVDINTGERVMSRDMPGTGPTWAYSTAADRSVYFGSSPGEIWKFEPDDMEVTLLSDETFGQTNLWASAISDAGRVVWSTYPDGKLFSYEPVTNEWHDHGAINPGQMYARSLDIVGETAYVGFGTQASIAVVDLETDAVDFIDVPEAAEGEEFVFDLDVREDLLFARFTPSNSVHIYDLESEAWVDEISQPSSGMGVSPVFTSERDGQQRREVLVRLLGLNGGTLAYDLDTGEETAVCNLMGGSSARMWSQVPMRIDGMGDEALVTANATGGFFAFDPATQECKSLPTEAAPAASNIRTMATGPEGDIYVGGPQFAHVDPETLEFTALPQSGQTQSFGVHDGYLLSGIYTSAGIDVWDPSQPREPGVNPKPRAYMGAGQDRTTAFTGMDEGRVAVGSFPIPGRLGGALGILNLESMEIELWDNLITDQSIYALEYADGLIYGGSGISGGLGVPNTEAEGRLFIFDPETSELVYNEAPVPGAGHVSGLTFDDDGMLWGLTGNSLFKFDPETRTVLRHHTYFDINDHASYITGRKLLFHDGRLVGSTAGTVFEVDPKTWDMAIIAEGVVNAAVDHEGRYYYSKVSQLYRWTPERAPEVHCDVELTGRLNGARAFVDTDVCLLEADLAGGLMLKGGSLSIENSRLNGGLTINSATSVDIKGGTVRGSVAVTGTAERFVVERSEFAGAVSLVSNFGEPFRFVDNIVRGAAACYGNSPALKEQWGTNSVSGAALGDCA